ncbi:MAG: hypothetical protein ACI3T9_03710 [Romboutsia timonensis]
MKLKVIKGIEQSYAEKEMDEFEVILKLYLLGATRKNKIVDISCFYGVSIEDLIALVNRIGGNENVLY